MSPVRVGVIGCGAISPAYFSAARNFPLLRIVACADVNPEAARARAAEFGIPKACSVVELLEDPSIEIVLNLTVPRAHVPVSLSAIEAGKHVYLEKPLGISREEGAALISAAEAAGVSIGCAPDTFLGAGIQTARKLIDDGAIGRPVAFTAFMMGRGHEHWHPSPEFYYQPGGGPMFDMGPYYLTALLNLLGPVKRVMGMASIAIPHRQITSKPRAGMSIRVETPDHVVGTMEFQNGCVGTIVTSFATRAATYDAKTPITIFGDRGTIKVPDPNGFDGPVFLCRFGDGRDEFVEQPPMFVRGYGRSVGLADMATGLRAGRAIRASGQQAMAVLDLMQGFLDSSASGSAVEPTVAYSRPAPMDPSKPFGEL
ncbi:MAG: Gfo/Idh/MocA family oxidoreductase [Phycisphaerae bacterium]|nr:Gfo/Idh/MocA family oxidoreductase [Phycisphaerae bacterium]MDW8261075.1 Gfo/Idh/MocA family oxidoreductase [Phycisphaerales bacterium]